MQKRSTKGILIFLALAVLLFSAGLFVLDYGFRNVYREAQQDRVSQIENTIKAYLDPILVAADILAEDIYLKNWLKDENDRQGLSDYINDRQQISGAGIIELASVKTEKVYQFSGSEVQMERENPRDSWYYHFMESSEDSNAELYYDTPSGTLYIYYNVKVKSSNGSDIAVLGVSFPYTEISRLLADQSARGTEIYITNQNGEIMIHPDQKKIGSIAIYDTFGLLQEGSEEPQQSASGNSDRILRYISNLDKIDSFLIIEQNRVIQEKERFIFLLLVILLFVLTLVVFFLFGVRKPAEKPEDPSFRIAE